MVALKNRNISSGPYEEALNTAISDLSAAQQRYRTVGQELKEVQQKVAGLSQLIFSLLCLLPKDTAEHYRETLRKTHFILDQQSRGGAVYDNVIALFRSTPQKEWSPTEAHKALRNQGKSADPKAVHNVFGYLSRAGRLRRVGRGRYLVLGMGTMVETSDDLGSYGPPIGGEMED